MRIKLLIRFHRDLHEASYVGCPSQIVTTGGDLCAADTPGKLIQGVAAAMVWAVS